MIVAIYKQSHTCTNEDQWVYGVETLGTKN